MSEMVLSYVLIVILITGLGYLLYLLKDKGINISEDYFGLSYSVLNTLQSDEETTDNKKTIIRMVSQVVYFIEKEFMHMKDTDKENLATKISKDAIKKLGFESPIDEKSIRFLIRIIVASMASKNDLLEDKKISDENKKIIDEIMKI